MDLDFGTSTACLNFFFFFPCIQQTWQLHSLICHRHSHQAWLQIKSQCLTIFPQIGGTSFILLFCSLQVSIIFVFLCLYILQLSLRWPWIWSALWVSWPQISISGKELAHARVGVWHVQALPYVNQRQTHVGKLVSWGKAVPSYNDHLKRSLVSNWNPDSHL